MCRQSSGSFGGYNMRQYMPFYISRDFQNGNIRFLFVLMGNLVEDFTMCLRDSAWVSLHQEDYCMNFVSFVVKEGVSPHLPELLVNFIMEKKLRARNVHHFG